MSFNSNTLLFLVLTQLYLIVAQSTCSFDRPSISGLAPDDDSHVLIPSPQRQEFLHVYLTYDDSTPLVVGQFRAFDGSAKNGTNSRIILSDEQTNKRFLVGGFSTVDQRFLILWQEQNGTSAQWDLAFASVSAEGAVEGSGWLTNLAYSAEEPSLTYNRGMNTFGLAFEYEWDVTGIITVVLNSEADVLYQPWFLSGSSNSARTRVMAPKLQWNSRDQLRSYILVVEFENTPFAGDFSIFTARLFFDLSIDQRHTYDIIDFRNDIAPGMDEHEFEPSLAFNPDTNQFMIAAARNRMDGSSQVLITLLSAVGAQVGEWFQLTNATEFATYPYITYAGNGTYVALVEAADFRTNTSSIVMYRLTASGSVIEERRFGTSTLADREPVYAYVSDQTAVISWKVLNMNVMPPTFTPFTTQPPATAPPPTVGPPVTTTVPPTTSTTTAAPTTTTSAPTTTSEPVTTAAPTSSTSGPTTIPARRRQANRALQVRAVPDSLLGNTRTVRRSAEQNKRMQESLLSSSSSLVERQFAPLTASMQTVALCYPCCPNGPIAPTTVAPTTAFPEQDGGGLVLTSTGGLAPGAVAAIVLVVLFLVALLGCGAVYFLFFRKRPSTGMSFAATKHAKLVEEEN